MGTPEGVMSARCLYNDGRWDFFFYHSAKNPDRLIGKLLAGDYRAVAFRMWDGCTVTVRRKLSAPLPPLQGEGER